MHASRPGAPGFASQFVVDKVVLLRGRTIRVFAPVVREGSFPALELIEGERRRGLIQVSGYR